jgi:hypothetical protein
LMKDWRKALMVPLCLPRARPLVASNALAA